MTIIFTKDLLAMNTLLVAMNTLLTAYTLKTGDQTIRLLDCLSSLH